MPTCDKILKEVQDLPTSLNVIQNYIEQLNKQTSRTIICYLSAFSVIKPPVPQPFQSIIDQDMQGFMTCSKDVEKNELDLIIHTPGGDYEATKRIIGYLQSIFKNIRVFVPHMAMSGGTLMACCADEIYMGPYSSLGPTDPQILLDEGYVSVNAIIDEFEQAFKEVTSDLSKAVLWNERLKKIPFGQLKAIENMRNNSLKYLVQLLQKRNCVGKTPNEIDAIAKSLNGIHSSHSEGIQLKCLQDMKLNVKDLSKQKDLEELVLSIYHAATILFQTSPIQKIIINHKRASYINQFGPANFGK
jgi:uncharacterized protein YfkK (UPF0435 family)